MADVAIVTASLDGYDRLRPQAGQDMDVDWLCFTDGAEEQQPWRLLQALAPGIPSLAAKTYKMLAPLQHLWVIWIDANMEVTSPTFARDALHCVRDGVAAWRHPRRDCIYEEVEASLGTEGQDGKYADQPLRAQAATYRGAGHPEHWGLFACGTLAWDRTDPRALELGAFWLAECERWSCQDQVSFPPVCRELDINPGIFPVDQIERRFGGRGYLGNRWLRIHTHGS